MKDSNKTKQLPIKKLKLSAMKYDRLQEQKEYLIKPKEEIRKPNEEIKNQRNKEKNYLNIVYEDGSEDEI